MNSKINAIENKNDYKENEINFYEVISLIKREYKTFLSTAGIIIILSLIYAVIKKPIYQGSFQIVVASPKSESLLSNLQNESGFLSSLISANSSAQNSISTEVKILESPSVLKPVFDFVKDQKTNNYKIKGADKLKFNSWRKDNFVIERAKGTSVLNIYYQDNLKEIIFPVTEQISKEYQIYSNRGNQRRITRGIQYLDQQINKYKRKLVIAQKKASDFSLENNISIAKTNTNLITNIELSNNEAKNAIKNLTLKIKSISEKGDMKNDFPKIISIARTLPLFNEIFKEYRNTEFELSQLRTKFQEKDPTIIRLREKKFFLKNKIKKDIKNFLESEIERNKLIISSNNEIDANIIVNYKNLIRDIKRNEAILDNLSNNLQKLGLEKAEESEPWELISNPTVLDKPIAPNRKKILFTGILGSLIFALIISFIKEKTSGLYFSINELKSKISYPLINQLRLDEKDKLEEYLSLYLKFLSDKKYTSIGFINIGKTNSKSLIEFEKVIRKISTDLNIIFSNKISETLKCSNQIILISKGEVNNKELTYMNETLNLRNDSVLGWFFINN